MSDYSQCEGLSNLRFRDAVVAGTTARSTRAEVLGAWRGRPSPLGPAVPSARVHYLGAGGHQTTGRTDEGAWLLIGVVSARARAPGLRLAMRLTQPRGSAWLQ